jgi:Mg2+-importing ATPase
MLAAEPGLDSGPTKHLVDFVTFVDPALPDAAELVNSLRRDGVKLKIVTGDNELVTRYICEQVGLDSKSIVLGDELQSMTAPTLAHMAGTADVFARVSPAQKNRIIIALRYQGHR